MSRGRPAFVATVAVADRPRTGASAGLLVLTLLLTALNLRAAVSSLGPVLRDLQLDLGMSDSVAGVLTTLPALCFGVVGLVTARVGRRLGTERAMVVALGMIAAGLVVRAVAPGVGSMLVMSLVGLIGIAIANVLVPVVVKDWFPDDVGRMTGWYSTSLAIGGAIPAAMTVPIAAALGGWRVGLGIWALPAVLALIPWAMIARARPRLTEDRGVGSPGAGTGLIAGPIAGPIAAVAGAGSGAGNAPPGGPPVAVHRQLQAWALAVFFGLQSLEAYTMIGWLPAILQDAGIGAGRAGVLLAVVVGVGAPVSLLIPRLAARTPDQRPWVVGLTALSAAAYLGLLLAPASAPLLWALLLGVGLGAFPLALLLIGLRASTAAGTIALSSLVQGAGYLLAATGPVTFGVLHERTGAWVLPLLVLLGLLVPKFVAGWIAAAPGSVDAAVETS